MIIINFRTEIRCYRKTEIREKYEVMNEWIECEYGFISRLCKNRVIKILYKYDKGNEESNCLLEDWYNEEYIVVNGIINNNTITVFNILIKDYAMGRW